MVGIFYSRPLTARTMQVTIKIKLSKSNTLQPIPLEYSHSIWQNSEIGITMNIFNNNRLKIAIINLG
ncbi:hypothetical protein HMPREF3264_00880 [Staphylococcus sp. HMSC62A08]|nr:hypothetical protein HMPREF3264_00880 [Staphylococcus sp. HMSC62A08]